MAIATDDEEAAGRIPHNKIRKEAKAKRVSSELTCLIWFLNSKPVDPGQRTVREEVANDLAPVITMAGRHAVLLRMEPLYDLIKKINRLKLRFRWFFWLVPAMAGASGNIKPGQKFLKFPDRASYGHYKKCLVYKWIDYGAELGPRFIQLGGSPFFDSLDRGDRNALRKASYGAIIESLEDGTLSRVKNCRECQRFFVAKRLSDRFCSPKCSESYFGRDVKDRVRKSREKKRREKREQLKQAVERKAFKRFSEFMRAAKGQKLTQEAHRMLKTLGSGEQLKGWRVVKKWEEQVKAGTSLADIWDGLSNAVKQVFDTA